MKELNVTENKPEHLPSPYPEDEDVVQDKGTEPYDTEDDE